jgi:hypothetical protein
MVNWAQHNFHLVMLMLIILLWLSKDYGMKTHGVIEVEPQAFLVWTDGGELSASRPCR